MNAAEDERSAATVQALWRIPTWFPDVPKETLECLKMFHVELLHFNAKVNLIGRGTERDSDETHFADSILGAQLLLKDTKFTRIHDVGSGNGLPGLVIAILDSSREVTLVEKDVRKAQFLRQIIFRLKVANAKVENIRFEECPAGSIDCASSRGLASISKALLGSNKCFHKDSVYYHFKTSTWSREVGEFPSQLCAVWTPGLVGEYALPNSQARRAVVVTKKIAE